MASRLLAAGGRDLSLLHASDRGAGRWSRWSYVAVDADASSSRIDPFTPDPAPARAGIWSGAPRWIGVVPYEALRRLERPAWVPSERRPEPAVSRIEWRRYPAVVAVDHATGAVFAVGEADAVDALALALDRAAPEPADLQLSVDDGEPAERHVERIEAARELIRRGDLYQVNLARPLRLRLGGGEFDAATALALHARLTAAAPSPFGACMEIGGGYVVSTSPELLLRATVHTAGAPAAVPPGFASLLTAPIKGTRPRGSDAEADAVLARDLDHDPKERAELAMIVDVERNDLGRVAVPGSVRLVREPYVVTHRTVHHREAWITARVHATRDRADVLRALLPSGSVTGAPKVRAMEVIAALEARRRGLYTGALGYVGWDGSLTLAMAIRTAVLAGDAGEYLAGGGIVADSDPGRELEETHWKAIQLARAVGV